jgi:hypothetical protein
LGCHSKEKDSLWGSAVYTVSDATEARTRVGDEPTTVAATRRSVGIGAAKVVRVPVKGLRTRMACGDSLATRTRRPPVVVVMKM